MTHFFARLGERMLTRRLLDLLVRDITGVRREKKLLNKNRIALLTASGEHVINDGWADISAALRDAVTRQGSTVVDDGPDAWHVG